MIIRTIQLNIFDIDGRCASELSAVGFTSLSRAVHLCDVIPIISINNFNWIIQMYTFEWSMQLVVMRNEQIISSFIELSIYLEIRILN